MTGTRFTLVDPDAKAPEPEPEPSPQPHGPPAGGPSGARDPETDRFHARRWRKHKLLALVIGALGGGLAGYANTTYGLAIGLPLVAVDPNLFLVVLVVLIAPVVEEHVKLLALVFLRSEERATYTPRRWLVLGAFAGAGFGLAEAALYWQAIAPTSLAAANLNLGMRLLLTVPMHALTVTATGYGYGLSRHDRSIKPLIQGLAVAILVHAAYNGFQILQALEGGL
ncbi:MAG: PrsW family glutamic-type intramembrane protease [Candidatus Thermoplasmatota archaeon]|nr:PrsW family glutamic-type intramembrane protease [Candidatus Thermoplasmatota archaeon]